MPASESKWEKFNRDFHLMLWLQMSFKKSKIREPFSFHFSSFASCSCGQPDWQKKNNKENIVHCRRLNSPFISGPRKIKSITKKRSEKHIFWSVEKWKKYANHIQNNNKTTKSIQTKHKISNAAREGKQAPDKKKTKGDAIKIQNICSNATTDLSFNHSKTSPTSLIWCVLWSVFVWVCGLCALVCRFIAPSVGYYWLVFCKICIILNEKNILSGIVLIRSYKIFKITDNTFLLPIWKRLQFLLVV